MSETSKKALELSVVIPVYRNCSTLEQLHERLSVQLHEISSSHQIVFVDDASPDGSRDELVKIARKDSNVTVICLGVNIGQHLAVMTGLAYSIGETLIIMDADLQDRPEDIPILVRELNKGYAAVFSGRRGRYQSAFRRLTARVFRLLMSIAAGVPGDAGLFLAMRSQTALKIRDLYAPHPFIQAMIGATSGPLTSVPIDRSARMAGISAYSSLMRIRMGLCAIWWALRWRYALVPNGRQWEPEPAVNEVIGLISQR